MIGESTFLQAGDLIQQAGISFSSGSGGGIDAGTIVLTLLFLVLGGIAAGGLAYWIIQKKQYKFKIVIFERINGKFQPSKNDKAKVVKLSTAGDEVISVKKHQKTLPMPSIQTGNNTFWYFISDDGEWINFGPGDFDVDRRELGAEFLDKEMRYARTELHNNSEKRYNQAGFWSKYGPAIAGGVMVLIIAISMYLLMDKVIEAINQTPQIIEANKELMERSEKFLDAVDKIQNSGSFQEASQ